MAKKVVAGTEVPPEGGKPNRFSLDERGREVNDGRPMAPPVGYKRTPSLAEQIREMVRSERIAAELEAQGVETFAEADDFNVGDDIDPRSPYEEYFEPTPLEELIARERAEREAQAPPQSPPKAVSDPGSQTPPGSQPPPVEAVKAPTQA